MSEHDDLGKYIFEYGQKTELQNISKNEEVSTELKEIKKILKDATDADKKRAKEKKRDICIMQIAVPSSAEICYHPWGTK